MPKKTYKVLSLLLCFLLIFEQSGFAQMAGQLDISGYLAGLRNALTQDKFRPLHLRYLTYDTLNNNFRILLDKGDLKDIKAPQVQETTQKLLEYFFVGVSLPNSSFWVNLRPDSPDNIIDPYLAQTDVGKILLEADLQLKKDTAKFTSPENPKGKEYWDKLYKKAGELFGYDNITIPTLTRPWIVPDEIIVREANDNAYIYKATLKVKLEQDHLKDSAVYNFDDPRLKELNEYSSQLIRELIIPELTKEINISKRYAPLKQVYYSLILAQWFKQKFASRSGFYSNLIDRRKLNGLTSKDDWSKTTYFKEYQKSFKNGEYNITEHISTPFGQTIRSYFSGGIDFGVTQGQGGVLATAIQRDLVQASTPGDVLAGNSHTLPPLEVNGGNQDNVGVERDAIKVGKIEEVSSPLTVSNPTPKGTPATLLRYMHDNKIFSDNPKKSSQMALQRGGNDSQRTIQKELQVLRASGLVDGNGQTGYYLSERLRNTDPEEIIRQNPELSRLGLYKQTQTTVTKASSPALGTRVQDAIVTWINSELRRPVNTPLDWETITAFNRQFKSSRQEQNRLVSSLWASLRAVFEEYRPKVITEDLSKTPSDKKFPLIIALGVPNTVVFGAKMKDSSEGLKVIDSDLMSAGKIIAAGQQLVALGHPVDLVSLIGQGEIGKIFEYYLKQIGFQSITKVNTEQDTRFAPNIIRDDDALEWHFSAPGLSITQAERQQLFDAFKEAISKVPAGTIVLMGGKSPVEADLTFWQGLIQHAKSRNLILYFDNLDPTQSGQDLQKILIAGVNLIKPNLDEFANLIGKDRKVFENNLEDIVREARELMNTVNQQGGKLETVVVSLAERGAILVTKEQAYHAIAHNIKVDNTLGAGDAFVGALAHKLSLNRPLNEAVQFAVAAATISSQKQGVVRVATLEEAERFAPEVKVYPVVIADEQTKSFGFEQGRPMYLEPTLVPKAWGAKVGKQRIGEYVFGNDSDGLVKVLTLGDSVSAQIHDDKDELLIITNVDPQIAGGTPKIMYGFSLQAKEKHGTNIKNAYKKAIEDYTGALINLIEALKESSYENRMVESGHVVPVAREVQDNDPSGRIKRLLTSVENLRQEVESFYNYVEVKAGDVIVIPKGTLHAAGAGIEIYEPQFPGGTVSFEDADKYPVRYAPANASEAIRQNAKGLLEWDKIGQIDENINFQHPSFETISEQTGAKIEDLAENLNSRLLGIQRITMEKDSQVVIVRVGQAHLLNVLHGSAYILVDGRRFEILKAGAGQKAIIIPAAVKEYRIVSTESGTQIIDTFRNAGSAILNVSDLPSNFFEFDKTAMTVALRFFNPNEDTLHLQQELARFRGVHSVSWQRDELTIVGDKEVVKMHPKQEEINERLGLKDRFYTKVSEQSPEVAVEVYHRDRRDERKKQGPVYVLGVVRNSHDSGAALIKDGVIIGAIEEERLVMDKHTRAYFPREATRYLLQAHGLTWEDINHIAVTYDYNFFRDTPHSLSPYKEFCQTYHIPGLESETSGRYNTDRLQEFLEEMSLQYGTGYIPPVTFVKHHKTHAAAAYYASGFPEPTLIIVIDGRGEDESTSIWLANNGRLNKISSTPYVHSLGHFYHVVTKYLGYKSHDEGKVMGFAPYGAPRDSNEQAVMEQLRALMQELVQFNPQTGQIEMNQNDFNFTDIKNFEDINFSQDFIRRLSAIVPILPKERIGRELKTEDRLYANLAFALQERIEQVISAMIKFYLNEHPQSKGVKYVVMSGGLALNIDANGKLIQNDIVDRDKFFVPAYPADDGTPVGAALSVADEEYGLNVHHDIKNVSLGREYGEQEIERALKEFGLVEGEDYTRVDSDRELVDAVSNALAENRTVAWFQGGSELGPRALGYRSILHRLDDAEGNFKVNQIKNREPWRPSAMSIQEEEAEDFIDGIDTSPFMAISFPVSESKKDLIKAGAHLADGTTRPQTVSKEANPLYWTLLNQVKEKTGIPGVLNTSFNRWGPIAETPQDALNTYFYTRGIDLLAIGHFLVKRTDKLKPGILNARDEPSLQERFNEARYHAKPMSPAWEAFWQEANQLVGQRSLTHQHYLVVYTVEDGESKEILRFPLVKEMFQRGPKEIMVADLAGRIQQKLGTNSKRTISIETTDKEYRDVVLDSFEKFSPPDIRARWNIVRLGQGLRSLPANTQIKLKTKEATERLSQKISDWNQRKDKTPILVAMSGPKASGKNMIINNLSGRHYVIDEGRWTIKKDKQDKTLDYPFSEVNINAYLNALQRLAQGHSAMVPLSQSVPSLAPERGLSILNDETVAQFKSGLIKSNSRIWIRNDGELFEQIIPEAGDVYLVKTSFALNYPSLRNLFEESYFVASSEELKAISESAEISRTPLIIRSQQWANVIVAIENTELHSDYEYPNPLIGLADPKVREFVRDILLDRFGRNNIEITLVDEVLNYALNNRLDPERATQEIYRRIIDFPDKNQDTAFHRFYYGEYKNQIKPRLIGGLVKGKITGPVVVDAGAGMSAIALNILQEDLTIERFISTHNVDYGRARIDDPRMEIVREDTKNGIHIPLENGVANTVIVTGRMHHLYRGEEDQFLKEIVRILRPDGKIIVIEDAWTESSSDRPSDKFAQRFRQLSAEQKQAATAFLDWIGTRLIPGAVPMARPWNFKSTEDWNKLFEQVGLKTVSLEYHGFQDEKFTALPLTTMELRPDNSMMSSEQGTDASTKGGVDFRALPIMNQPLNTSKINMSLSRLDNFSIDPEWKEIQNMVNAGIIPSGQRIKDYLQSCCQKKELNGEIVRVLNCIADIMRIEEERVSTTDQDLKSLLVLLESGKTVDELQEGLNNIVPTPKIPQ